MGKEYYMIRFGLCCIFVEEPIKFRTTTAKALLNLPPHARLQKVSSICLSNMQNLLLAVQRAHALRIGAFRILSTLFPRYTHPEVGYTLDILPDRDSIAALMTQIGHFASTHDIRLSFHPDQFIVLNSPYDAVVKRSIIEIEYQGLLAEILGAEAINIHAGGIYGDKREALERFKRNFGRLSDRCQQRITLENDDVCFSPTDILPVCRELSLPCVYDVHHQRCNPDNYSEEEATHLALDTWRYRKQEPWLHISSPKNGWNSNDPKPHADYIDVSDVPPSWYALSATLDVEAKAKEKAVIKLMGEWPK